MKNGKNRKGSGISIKLVHAAMLILGVLLIALLIFTNIRTSSVFTRLNKETGNYIVRQKAAHDLMEASDYLTEMTQRFTLEGDTQYLDNYFEEAFGNKRREASITTMAENEAEQTLIDQIQAALNESNSLMFREYYAMKLVIDAKEIKTYPDTLRGVELKEEDIYKSPEEKMDLVIGNIIDGSDSCGSDAELFRHAALVVALTREGHLRRACIRIGGVGHRVVCATNELVGLAPAILRHT